MTFHVNEILGPYLLVYLHTEFSICYIAVKRNGYQARFANL